MTRRRVCAHRGDEVGRGCLAGPVVAAAVILQPDHYVAGVADSKLLTADDRDRLFPDITRAAVHWSVSIVSPGDIDRLNIHQASLLAMRQAVTSLVPLPLRPRGRLPDSSW
jgi:ribonuclease HII